MVRESEVMNLMQDYMVEMIPDKIRQVNCTKDGDTYACDFYEQPFRPYDPREDEEPVASLYELEQIAIGDSLEIDDIRLSDNVLSFAGMVDNEKKNALQFTFREPLGCMMVKPIKMLMCSKDLLQFTEK